MKFYKPDYGTEPDSPFARDSDNKLVRRNYWYDIQDASIITLFNNGIGANLTNEEKKNHLIDIKKEYLIDEVCVQEILPPEN
tara:strand:+ start:291 stop:536 length:246 start_codon:yes stop_codon:yes gene_type:complete